MKIPNGINRLRKGTLLVDLSNNNLLSSGTTQDMKSTTWIRDVKTGRQQFFSQRQNEFLQKQMDNTYA